MRHIWLSILGLASAATPAAAQGWIEIERPRRPEIRVASVERVASEIRTTIDGRIVRVEVEERFRNNGGVIAEGNYLYPMPGEAVFQNFSLWMGDQELKGEMMNAEQARGIYEEIVRRQKDPALLTLAGHGLVRAQVFPIQPGETRKVVLRYTQLVDRAGDALRIRYALGKRGGSTGRWTLAVPNAADYGTPYSPTHRIDSERRNGRLEVTIDTRDGGDIELLLPIRRGLVGTSVLAHAPGGEDGYLMLLLAPSVDAEGPVVPRDIAFVVDVSGSMSGQKMEQAKGALRQALGTLRPEDRFRLVAFSSGVRQFRDGWAPSTRDALDEARAWVDNLVADGGTNISGALDAVLGSSVPEDRLPLVLFLTDGVPSVGEQQPDRIAAMAASRVGRSRVFTIGVGHDVNTYLLDRLAKEGRGAAEYVAPDANVEVTVGSLMNKLRRPALVNLRIVDAPARLHDLSPAVLPDLFYGEELVLFGRYDGSGNGQIVIEGERNGRRERFTARAELPRSENGNDFIPRLWASRRIGDLTRQIRLEGSESAIREVRELGLRYGILTEYTSYLVQEPTPLASADARQVPPGLRTREGSTPMPAAAPMRQTGQVAFDRAKESGQFSAANSLADADAAAEKKMASLGAERSEMRRAGGHVFVKKDGIWTDLAHTDSLKLFRVAPFSPAYFAVTRALPELTASLRGDEPVIIAGRQASVEITSGGRESMTDAEIRELARMFRGQ
ncbi:MAG TPA: VIT domain-containing protein [Gemmatimonadales bacterium]|nr:VIT domain-containing protein [Gemmatimonadales bacterium]